MKHSLVYKYLSLIYVCIWTIFCFYKTLLYPVTPIGEWDDYSITTASLINDGNMTISKEDLSFAKKYFLSFSQYIDKAKFSSYVTSQGNEIPWYFGTYSMFCVPIAKVLNFFDIDPSYCFFIVNLLSLVALLIVAFKYTHKINYQNKLLLILLLSINPILYYLTWISAEVFIYSLLSISVILWYEKYYKTSAFILSLAGTLNPVFMFIGFTMIAWYLFGILKKYNVKNIKNAIDVFWKERKNIYKYGLCFVIALIPMIYNYYHVGHINLSASNPQLQGKFDIMVFKRFWAYLFDFDFGFIAHVNIIFILGIALIYWAIKKKDIKYCAMVFSFFGCIFLYSFMKHINCGMSGMHRYNADISGILITAIIYFINNQRLNYYIRTLFYFSIFLNLALINKYGFIRAINYNYVTTGPISTTLLNNYPSLYNPLHSTFNSRINHKDGGYWYKLPIEYIDSQDKIRKILVAPDSDVSGIRGESLSDQEWFDKQFKKVTKEEYISVPKNINLKLCKKLVTTEPLYFMVDKQNFSQYIFKGISSAERDFTWSSGKNMYMNFSIDKYDVAKKYDLEINIQGTFNGEQSIIVWQNNQVIYETIINGKSIVNIPISQTDNGCVELMFEFPNAVSPISLGINHDRRQLAVRFEEMILTEHK